MVAFGAINFQAQLSINGHVVGTNTTSFLPSTFDITPYVSPGHSYILSVLVKGRDALMDSRGYYTVPDGADWYEIARRAGVTWGTIQHQFGTREGLLLDVVSDGWVQLERAFEEANIEGTTLEVRLASVMDLLSDHYGTAPFLAHLQILFDLIQNPTTSEATRKAALDHGKTLSRAWQPLFARALGEAAQEKDLVVYAFKTLRGYLMGDLIASRISSSTVRQQRAEAAMVVQGVAAVVRTEAGRRGIDVDNGEQPIRTRAHTHTHPKA